MQTEQSAALAVPEPHKITAMELLQSAVNQGASIDTIERLAKLQREMMDYEAKLAFDGAMARVQTKMRRIGADATNPQTRSKYVTYAKLDAALRPLYTEEGFGLSFDTGETSSPDVVRVVCYVSHLEGHTRTYHIDMPSDGKGAKGGDVMTKTHATGAAASYGARYLLKLIFNVAVGESDDDGNGAADPQLANAIARIKAARDLTELQEVFAAEYKGAKDAGDTKAMQSLLAAKDIEKAKMR